ncbi:MAG: ThuA domain-containing protein [Planctomycetes bacterium]|nr:ThuA domain-containing protein [Planctomycetota bacterium]
MARFAALRVLPLAFAIAACAGGPAPAPAPARVLLVTGEDYPGHHWRETAPVVAELLASAPDLEVDTIDELGTLGAIDLAGYAVVVAHFKNYDPAVPGRAGFDALARFVDGGGGLVLLHFACGAFQEFAADYERLAGRVWNPALRGHDPHGTFTVEIVDHRHPVTRGLASYETIDELYTCLDGEVPIEVLAQARSRVDDRLYPMAFVLAFGAGRVFHTPLGHDVAAFRSAGTAELIRRGTRWAAHGDR